MILPKELLRQILEAQIACGQKLLYMLIVGLKAHLTPEKHTVHMH